jgi:AcrR family transcriptional regulator
VSNATEQRIIAAAIKLFAERGSANLTMSDLAAAAGVARGTLYRNVESVDQLFDQVVSDLGVKLHANMALSIDALGDIDPALRLPTGLRMLIRIAHDDPAIGRFIVRFGLTNESLRSIVSGPPMQDVAAGVAAHRFDVGDASKLGVASLLMGSAVAAIWTVLEGHQGWREAGSSTAELVLRSLGVSSTEARRMSRTQLPPFRGAVASGGR